MCSGRAQTDEHGGAHPLLAAITCKSTIRPRRLSPRRRGCSGRFPLPKLAALHGRPEGALAASHITRLPA